MALNASDLKDAILAGILAIPVLNDSQDRTYGDEGIMTQEQKDKMEESISVYADKIVEHIVTAADLEITMVNHTHDSGLLLIAPPGGGPCTGLTGTPTSNSLTNKEYGKPEDGTGGIT